jgi:hypothetical protein
MVEKIIFSKQKDELDSYIYFISLFNSTYFTFHWHNIMYTHLFSKFASTEDVAAAGGILDVVTVFVPSGRVTICSITIVPSISNRWVVVSVAATGISICTASATAGEATCWLPLLVVVSLPSGIIQQIAAVTHQKRNAIIDVTPPSCKLQPREHTFELRMRRVKS